MKGSLKFSFFLVDNGSKDGTSESVCLEFLKVKIIQGYNNLFWNLGMDLAWGVVAKINLDFYLWLNDETFLFENRLFSLLESAHQKENQSIIVVNTISEKDGLSTDGGKTVDGKIINLSKILQECSHFAVM